MPIITEAVRIDWKKALEEVEDSLSNKVKEDNAFEEAMHIAELNCRIRDMYKLDNTMAYLELLDENRKILKPFSLYLGEDNYGIEIESDRCYCPNHWHGGP